MCALRTRILLPDYFKNPSYAPDVVTVYLGRWKREDDSASCDSVICVQPYTRKRTKPCANLQWPEGLQNVLRS